MSTDPSSIEVPNSPTALSYAPAGWANLIDEAIEVLDREHPGWAVRQIKEKFGGLRISYDARTEDHRHRERVRQIIDDIESSSYQRCDICGASAKVITSQGLRRTRCTTHEHAEYRDIAIVVRPVRELTAHTQGVWNVETRGSTHRWDLDNMTYTRRPGSHSRAGGMEFDGMAMQITRVEAWPQIGASFFVWFDDPSTPELLEHYRISSAVQDIKRHPDTGSHHDE